MMRGLMIKTFGKDGNAMAAQFADSALKAENERLREENMVLTEQRDNLRALLWGYDLARGDLDAFIPRHRVEAYEKTLQPSRKSKRPARHKFTSSKTERLRRFVNLFCYKISDTAEIVGAELPAKG